MYECFHVNLGTTFLGGGGSVGERNPRAIYDVPLYRRNGYVLSRLANASECKCLGYNKHNISARGAEISVIRCKQERTAKAVYIYRPNIP